MKKIVFFVVGLLLLTAVPVTVYIVSQQQDIRSRAAPATTLSFNPTTITKPVDEQFTVNVDINTGTNSVTAIKVVVTFDSTKLEATSITNGALAPKITASGTVAAGTASITVAASSTTAPIQGTGTVAIIRFKGKTATTTPVQLKFDTATFASGLAESTNVITTMGTATVIISGTTTGASPTVTPTASASNAAGANAALPTTTPTTTSAPIIPTEEITPTPAATDSAVITDGTGGNDEVPVTGSTENTYLLLALGIGCILLSGVMLAKTKQTI